MKKKYYFHPSSFSLSEIEGFYEEKARKGLFLEKRGHYLSRIRIDEPKELLYRVEVVDFEKEENKKIQRSRSRSMKTVAGVMSVETNSSMFSLQIRKRMYLSFIIIRKIRLKL